MDTQKERGAFEAWYCRNHTGLKQSDLAKFRTLSGYSFSDSLKINVSWEAWQAAKAQAVPAQLDVNSILHDIDCYFDNGLSNTERTANNLLQSIYEKLSGEVKAQEPAK